MPAARAVVRAVARALAGRASGVGRGGIGGGESVWLLGLGMPAPYCGIPAIPARGAVRCPRTAASADDGARAPA
ncbi:hypothetical protein MANAM107_06490 [Actinomyces capricornis]|uniref:Uncharacterized protein n=1 Tax=Actinomyces capricornis TaxID=2755559 RepID=A0ABM7UET4_9ACTO|nr:hypothetical protein MANAM107_06490 [Actinomyces capricornis]